MTRQPSPEATAGTAPENAGTGHIPVLMAEAVAALAPRAGGLYIDGTFGRGGYTRAILGHAGTHVVAIDRDPEAIAHGTALARQHPDRLTMVEGTFGGLDQHIAQLGLGPVDGVALDLGISSPQIDQATRGFSFRMDGPLDMRMGRDGPSAADAVNELDEAELARVIYELGEERHSRRIARKIVAARALKPFSRTSELAEIVRQSVPRSNDGIDPATRTFQALRIHVNDEMGELDRGLIAAEKVLKPGGRLAVVTFHSLEDRAVKTFLNTRSSERAPVSRHAPVVAAGRTPSFRLLSRKAVAASAAEIAANPRARSAKLRAAERTEATAWGSAA